MKKRISILYFSIFVLLLFSSCQEPQKTSSLTLNISQENTKKNKSILPEDIPLDVTQYTITGKGPFEKDSFSVSTHNNTATVKGLTVGNWDILAIGKNSDGLLLVSGKANVDIKKEPTSIAIELDTLVGNGNIKIDFNWDSQLINNPKLELELINQSNNKIKVNPTTIDYTQGVATYESVARADSYIMNAKLYDSEILVSGCMEAIRVVMNKTSSGVIHFTLNENNSPDLNTPIVITNHAGVPSTCYISEVPEVINYNQEVFPILKEENNLPLSNFSIDWYLDGELIGSGIDCSFIPNIGFHRLDVVVENGDIGSLSSAFKEFEVKLNAPSYMPKVIKTINNGDFGYYAGSNMHICFLPDNKILSYCGETNTIQICRLINNNIEVIKTYNNSFDMPIANVIDIKVDSIRNRVFISEESTNAIYIYDYSYNKLTKYFSDDTYHKYANHFGQIFIRPQDFLVFDHLGDSYREYNIDPINDSSFYAVSMVKNPDEITYHCSKGLMSPNLDSVAFASDTGYISFAYNTPGYSNCLLRATSPIRYNANEILVAGALDWKTFIAGANNRIIIGSLSGDDLNYSSTLEEKKTYISNTYGMPDFSDVSDFIYYTCYDELNNLSKIKKIYALCSGSNDLLAFDFNQENYSLSFIGKEDLVDFTPENGVLSNDKKTLIITGKNEKCIKICQIHD